MVMAVLPETLDRDPWAGPMLPMKCSTYAVGRLQRHDRGDSANPLHPVAYDPGAVCPIWGCLWQWTMAGNADLISFLAEAVGDAITGMIREHVLLDSRAVAAMAKVPSWDTWDSWSLCHESALEWLLAGNNDRHPTERADLFQKRFVSPPLRPSKACALAAGVCEGIYWWRSDHGAAYA